MGEQEVHTNKHQKMAWNWQYFHYNITENTLENAIKVGFY